jgi:hypothetical protein
VELSDNGVAMLRMSFDRRAPAPGLVHHSDRGSQYARRAYIDLLLTVNQIRFSMSRRAKPWDKCRLRAVHEDFEVRGGVAERVSRSGRGPRLDRQVAG